MQTLPPYAFPLFGTFSVASILALVIAALKFRADVTKALAETVMKSDAFIALLLTLATEKALEAALKAYMTKEAFRDYHGRLKHLEASCPNCHPLKETKGVRREDV